MADIEEHSRAPEDKESETPVLSVGDNSLKGGRNRICKQCKFTCKDSREFSQHQLSAHGESEDTHCIQNSISNNNNNNNNKDSNNNSSNISGNNTYRRNSAKSCSPQIGISRPDFFINNNNNNNNNNIYKMSREEDDENSDHIYRDTEDDELEDRLIIAEDQDDSFSHTPIRSGNIQNRTYICPFCDFSSTSAKIFLHHQKDIHGKDFTIYECDVCDYATKYKQKLPRHRKLHFPGLEFNSSSVGVLGPITLTGDNTQDTSDIIITSEVDIRKRDEEMDDELDDEDMEIVMEDGNGIDDSQKQKTKRTRQEVDPAKYIEVMDDVGIKYSCSKCGNIYKWRKSLNKHWKEKHADEKLDGIKQISSPHNPVKLGNMKINHEMIRKDSCEKLIYKKEGQSNGYADDGRVCHEMSRVSDCVMPKMIGPFVTNSYMSVYSTENGQSSGQANTDQGVLDLSRKTPTSLSSNTQREPIDFSFKKEPYTSANVPGVMSIKAEPIWDNEQDVTEGGDDQKQTSPVLQCPRCSFVAKTFIDYSSHMAVHLNKRAFKCAECQQHFNCVEELNKHFAEVHVKKIHEHRDVIQKIPHGLQQTYHLLRMPLPSNEFNCTEQRQLKCSRCDFVAKWPAELQKHAVSHSEERPFICMVCGSTYKWKWDLVKHFEKSHSTLTNPYKRRATILGANISEPTISRTADALVDSQSLDSIILPPKKKRRLSETDLTAIHSKYLDLETRSENLRLSRSSHSNRSSPLFFRERSSSVPPYLNNFPERDSDDNSMPGLQITNVYSLVKDKTSSSQPDSLESSSLYTPNIQPTVERLTGCSDQFSSFEDQHKAVNAALRQRISMSSNRNNRQSSINPNEKDRSCADILLPYKCTLCQYRARWPSEITQHMKNHSDEKPFCCPECSYKSKWKWDVVKHMKRCGGGTVKDVIDKSKVKVGPPNVVVAVREEPNDNDTMPKAPSNVLINGDINQFTFKPIIPGKMPPVTPVIDISDKVSTDVVDPPPPKPPSVLDLRKESVSKPNPYFRDLINNGLYHCLECQFVGHSPAELKRHAYLHSEDKPYVCEVCTYSSRWKCDLKKHIRTYNHYGSGNSSQLDNTPKHSSPEGFGDVSISEEPKVYKCNHCFFESDSKLALDQHTETHEKETVKHRCLKCNFVTDDSIIFSQHQLTHENTSTSSTPAAAPPPPVANTAKVSSRTRHLKNCRRPIKQYHCNKCPYVCLDDMDLVVHKEGHKPQGSNAFQCFFCDFSVHQKIQLINHLYLHPEFETSDKSKLNEILHYSQLSDVWQSNRDHEDMDLSCDDSLEYYSSSSNYDLNKEKKLGSSEYKREETEMEEKENRFINGMSSVRDMPLKRLQCEWCEVAFAHISTLYQHARSVHPILLQQQEYENNIKYDDLLPPPPPPNYNGVAVSQNSAFNPILPKVIQTPKKVLPTQLTKPQKNPSPGKTGGPFKCQKCPFIGASSNTYSRHMERHGSNCKHTCLYCDYSIDRLNLLHQHMRGSHGHDVKQSPLNSSVSDKTSPNGGSHKQEMGSRVILSTPTYIQKNDGSSESHLRPIAPKPVEGTHPEISPSLPILENGPNGKYMYRCPNCSFCSSKVANTSAHIRTHYFNNNFADTKKYGEKVQELSYTPYLSDTTNKKFNNKLDNPINARPLNCDCSDMLNLSKSHQPAKIPPKNMLLCLQCPFKTTTKEFLQEHQEFHGYKGQYRCSECNFSVDHVNLFCDHSALHSASNQNPNNNDNNNNINSIGNNNRSNNNNNNNNISSMNTSQINYRSNEAANNKTNLQKMGGDHLHSKYDNNERRGKLNLQQMLKQVKMAGRVRYKCSRCPYRTCCKNNIIKHRKQHIVNSRYKCQYCNYSAARKYLLQQHLKFHRDEASEQEKEFQDVVLDPYDENSVKSLKESSDYNKDLLTPKLVDHFNRRRKPSSGESTSVPMSLMMRAKTEGDGDEQSDMLEDEDKHFSDDQNYENKRRNFHCSLCPFSCNTAVVFQRHSQFHNANLKYKCDFCNYSVDRLNLLTQHSRLHSQQTNYPPPASLEDMPVMDFSSPSSSFSSHNAYMNQKSSKDNNDRNIINPSSLDEQAMGSEKFQMLEMGSEGNEEAMRYHCKLCPYMSNSLKSYNVHSSMHGCEGKYKCDYCDWSANRLNLLNQHRKVHSREPGFDPNPDELTFLNREALLQSTNDARACNKLKNVDARHLINPKTKKCYSCKVCPFSCNNKSSFLLHLGLHRNPARYKCSQCSYSVSRWNLLQQHERTHLSENEGCNFVDDNGIQMNSKTNQGTLKARLRCPKCPYHCYAQHLLETHMKMHETGERCVCNYCDYSTENWEVLQKHMEIHNGMTNLLCSTPKLDSSTLEQTAGDEECDNENSLRRSYCSENECEDGYRCDQCPFTTPSLDILQQHESQHEDIDDSTSCSYCQFTCRKESEMEKHMRTHHYDQTYNEEEEEEEEEEGDKLRRTENKSEECTTELDYRVSETSQNNDDCINTKLESNSPTENELKINETGESSPVEEEEEEEDGNNLIDDSPTSAKSKLGSTSFECQYCDRGFDDETSMQEHEKHHYKAYDSIQQ